MPNSEGKLRASVCLLASRCGISGVSMHVTRYTDADAFYERVEPFLLPREAENNLLFGVLNGVRAGEMYKQSPYMAGVEHDGQLVLAALRTPPANFILSTTQTPEALAPLMEDACGVYERLTGLMTASELAEQAARAWQAASGQVYRRGMAMRIYKLERVNAPVGVQGALRRAGESDRELLSRWMTGFFRDTFGSADDAKVEQSMQQVLGGSPDARGLHLWTVDGQTVAMAGYSGPTPHGIRVGMVYTPPELRGRGYASACTAALSQRLLDMGRTFCFLFTDLGNPTSNHIYQEIGYEAVCDVDEYTFEG
jgi:uncharacterized protein